MIKENPDLFQLAWRAHTLRNKAAHDHDKKSDVGDDKTPITRKDVEEGRDIVYRIVASYLKY
jgi:hypothetical protein